MYTYEEDVLRKEFEEWFETYYLPDGEVGSFERYSEYSDGYKNEEEQAAWCGYCMGALAAYEKVNQDLASRAKVGVH